MKTISTLALMFTIAIASVASAQDAEQKSAVKIVKETKIFALDKSRDITENNGIHSMRISPDGKTLLYIERTPPGANENRRGYRLALRDIKTGKDTILPGAPSGSDDFLVAYVSMQPFDATNAKVILPVCISENNEPVRPGAGQMQLGIYEIATGKLTKPDLKAPIIFPSYDAAGKNIIVFEMAKGDRGPDLANSKIVVSPADKIKFRKISIIGMPRSPCPTGDILPILLPPARDQGQEIKDGIFVLCDTKTDKKLPSPPITSGKKLDDFNPQWTGDGRYLYYVDTEKDKTPEGNTRHKRIMRVWDNKKAVEQSIMQDTIPIGPALSNAGMIVLGKKNYAYSIHDPVSGKLSPILDGKSKIISVTGQFLVCVKQDAKGAKFVYLTEMK